MVIIFSHTPLSSVWHALCRSSVREMVWRKNVRAHPPRAGRHKERRACHGRCVAPVPLKGRPTRVAGPGSRVWACTRCRLVAFPDHLAHRRQTPLVSLWSGKRQMVRKRDLTGGSDEQRAADEHRRCFAYPPGQAWLRSINQAPHATPELSRWCRAHDARESRRGILSYTQIVNCTAMEMRRGVGNYFEKQII